MTRQGSVLDTVHMEFGYWAAQPSVPDSNTLELRNLNFDVQVVVFLLSIEILFIRYINVSSLGFQTDSLQCIFISKSSG